MENNETVAAVEPAAPTPNSAEASKPAKSDRARCAKERKESPVETTIDLNDPKYYLNREINWIDFNEKVLSEAEDPRVPLLERVKFLSIFWNNLDEFFMVRVANVFRQEQTGVAATGADGIPPRRQLTIIRQKVSTLVDRAEDLWLKTLQPALREKGVVITKFATLGGKKRQKLEAWFEQNIYPVLTPQVVDSGHPFPWISNTSLNFLIELVSETDEEDVRYARLKCPNNIQRFLFLSKDLDDAAPDLSFQSSYKNVQVILTEDLIGECLGRLFPGFRVTSYGLFRITRNTDAEIEEDEADDLLEAVRDYVEQRRFGAPVRLELERGMPVRLQNFLLDHIDMKPGQIYKVSGPLAFSEFMDLCFIDRPSLQYVPDRMTSPEVFDPENDLFATLRERDVLLFHPYEKFTGVLSFIDRAARDPKVVAIKQTLYRCGSNSPIIKSLIEARRRGKQVTAVVELKARFDEERNINWAEALERSGVNVVYGFVGLKVHAKLCLVVRREATGIRRYVHIGTGNYNALSATIYTDLGLFTSNEEICADVTDLFNVMTGCGIIKRYRQLGVSPLSLRTRLVEMIRREVEAHRETGDGHIVIKCNQLADDEMIRELYRASQAGVKIECIVRGVCCLRPGVPGVSENITVRSIVGRYLEHARVYWFKHGGDDCMWIGSADMMKRNLNGRIEVITPVHDPRLRERITKMILDAQLADTRGAWSLDADGKYTRVRPKKGEAVFDSQNAEFQRKGVKK